MPISGLVLQTRSGLALEPLVAALAAHPGLTPGAPIAGRVPLVVESEDAAADKAVWAWLRARPEVLDVAVALIHLDEPPAGGNPSPSPA